MTAAVGSGKNATASNPASTAACSRRTRASACEAARLDGSEPAKTTGCPSTTRRAPSETAASASFFNRLSTTATSEPTVKSVAQELVPAKPTFARSCFTPDSSRASLQPPPLRYCRQSVSQPYGARAQFQQSVFSCPNLRKVFTASSPAARFPPRCRYTKDGSVIADRDGPNASTSTRSAYATEIALLLVPKSMPYPTRAAAGFTTAPYIEMASRGGSPARPYELGV